MEYLDFDFIIEIVKANQLLYNIKVLVITFEININKFDRLII